MNHSNKKSYQKDNDTRPNFKKLSDLELRVYLTNHLRRIEDIYPKLREKKKINREEARDIINADYFNYRDMDYVLALFEYSNNRGLEFEPYSWEEVKDNFFNNFDHLNCVQFSEGGFFQGHSTFKVDFLDNDGKIFYQKLPEDFEKDYKVIGKITKDDLIDLFKKINLLEWKQDYNDPFVCDGTQWNLSFEFNDLILPDINIYGSNEFPPTYNQLYNYFSSFIPKRKS